MDLEYNKLTEQLLKEGYTADHHPDYVKLPNCLPDSKNPLRNYDGGFIYLRSHTDKMIYKTGCGKYILGENVIGDMEFMGIDWCHENDNPVFLCPYHTSRCGKNHPLLHESPDGEPCFRCWCVCHQTRERYDYQNSIELAEMERQEDRQKKYQEYSDQHNGRICQHHMYYDERTRTWELRYDPAVCFRRCRSRFCPILGRNLDRKRGNVYYDLKVSWIRQDGTLFDGEKIVSITRGIRYFKHPASMDICRAFVKLCSGNILSAYRLNNSQYWLMDKTFQAEVLNIRAESKPSRDLAQDLQAIKDGISITYDSDLQKLHKEQAHKKRREAREKRIQKLERKLLEDGYESLAPYSLDKIHADKWLSQERLLELEEARQKRIWDEQHQPVQLTLPLDMLQA